MSQIPQMTGSDWIAIERELAKRSLARFAAMAWPILEPSTDLKWGWALDALSEHLEAITYGHLIRLLVNVPPGTMKSLMTNVIWPAWEWGPAGMPYLRHIGTAHKQDLAIRDSLKCRRLIQSKWYQDRWPTRLVSDQNAKTKFENEDTGVMESMAFVSMTGSRGDRVRLDDPISADDANSEAALMAAELTFTEALPTRVNNDKSAIVVIMQRLHERDISGLILSRDLGYTHLCLPMRYEPKRKCSTPFYTDPRTEEGELLFPQRFPEAQVVELEKILGSHATAGQLQQRPTPRGGGILKSSWLGYWKSLPKLEWRSIFADTAMKTGQDNDYSVFQCWGRSTVGQAVLIDQIRGKWEAPELLIQARKFWAKHSEHQNVGPLRAIRIEDKVSGTGLIQTLRREGVPCVPVQRSRDKISRGHDAAPFMESGNVLLPEDAAWVDALVHEIEAFPNGRNDDQIDPMLDAIREVQTAPPVEQNNVTYIEEFSRPALGSRRSY